MILSIFLENFNGAVEIHATKTVQNVIYVDSNLHEMGAYYKSQVCNTPIMTGLVDIMSIVHFEAANIILALRF